MSQAPPTMGFSLYSCPCSSLRTAWKLTRPLPQLEIVPTHFLWLSYGLWFHSCCHFAISISCVIFKPCQVHTTHLVSHIRTACQRKERTVWMPCAKQSVSFPKPFTEWIPPHSPLYWMATITECDFFSFYCCWKANVSEGIGKVTCCDLQMFENPVIYLIKFFWILHFYPLSVYLFWYIIIIKVT